MHMDLTKADGLHTNRAAGCGREHWGWLAAAGCLPGPDPKIIENILSPWREDSERMIVEKKGTKTQSHESSQPHACRPTPPRPSACAPLRLPPRRTLNTRGRESLRSTASTSRTVDSKIQMI